MLSIAVRRQRGFNLIELGVVLSIVAFLMLMGAPTFGEWIRNSRIRATAEAVQLGLQTAKAEAVSRNARVRFQLTTTLGNDCAVDRTGTNWVINMDPMSEADRVAGACATPPNPNVPDADPGILQTRSAGEGSQGIQVAASADSIVFTGLGRIFPVPADVISYDITNAAGGNCLADGGTIVCLRVLVSPAGQIRMCNPNFPAGDPQGC